MRPRLSVVAIAKNERHNLQKFLISAGLVADEIVIVDTGSTDGTCEALKKVGFTEKGRGTLKLRHFAWRKDFAAARNFSLRHATGEWVLWMDLDDRLSKTAPAYINELKRHDHRKTAFGFLVVSESDQEGTYVKFLQARMFPNLKGIRWTRPIHEKLHPSFEAKGIHLEPVQECTIIHTGYTDPMLKRQKAMRNAMILESLSEETYERFYELGDAYYASGEGFEMGLINYYRARGLAETELQKNSATERIILGRMVLHDPVSAREEYKLLPEGVPEQVFWEAEFAFADKDYDKAGPLYERILDFEYQPQSMNSYLDAYKARALKILGWMQERYDAEEAQKGMGTDAEEGCVRNESDAAGCDPSGDAEGGEAGAGSDHPEDEGRVSCPLQPGEDRHVQG